MAFSSEIINVLDYLCGKFGIAIDWTSENVMPYLEDLCSRYISYEVYASIAWMVIIPVITILVTIPLSILHKKAKEVEWDDCYAQTIFAVIFWVLFVGMCIASIFVVCEQTFDIIECYTIPENVIFKYVNNLMKNAK